MAETTLNDEELAQLEAELHGDLNLYKLRASAVESQKALEAIGRIRRLLCLDDLETATAEEAKR